MNHVHNGENFDKRFPLKVREIGEGGALDVDTNPLKLMELSFNASNIIHFNVKHPSSRSLLSQTKKQKLPSFSMDRCNIKLRCFFMYIKKIEESD